MKRGISILTLLASSMVIWAEAPNPFTSSGGPSAASTAVPASNFLAALAPFLRSLTDRLTELAGQISRSPDPKAIMALSLVAMLYGVFHSLGPGHGKTVVSTFFLTKDAKLSSSLAAGGLLALFHALSATTIVLALYFIVRGVFSTGFESANRIVQLISFGLIALIGGVMLIRRILGLGHRHLIQLGPSEFQDLGQARAAAGNNRDWRASLRKASPEVHGRELAGIALAAGVVPCPGASAIILVCLSLNALMLGVLAVGMISIGMGLTISVIGAIAILAKRGVLKASGSKPGKGSGLARRIIEIGGSAILFVFGLAFFIAQF